MPEKMKVIDAPMVRIEWRDCTRDCPDWHDIDVIDQLELGDVVSVGMLVRSTKETKTVVFTSGHDNIICGRMCISTHSITKLRYLEPRSKSRSKKCRTMKKKG